MSDAHEEGLVEQLARVHGRLDELEARVARMEGRAAPGTGSGSAASTRAAATADVPAWTQPYQVAELELGQTWIEMHETSARPQLYRLILEVLEVEGPVTEALALRRVREAWGLRRAGARVQEVFEQALRHLAFQGKVERSGGNTIGLPGQQLQAVRVPGPDESTRRAVDEIPPGELELALERLAADAGAVDPDELTSRAARLFGWTRRGTEIQTRLDARLQALLERGALRRDGARVVGSVAEG